MNIVRISAETNNQSKKTMMITVEQANAILRILQDRPKFEEEFSSHDFIQEYCRQYETEYLDWLMEYHGSGKAFQTVHGLIGKYLSEHYNDLHIAPIGKHDSECIHGTIDRPMWWQWERYK